MKFVFTIALIFATFIAVFAQHNQLFISGVVKSKDGEVLVNAHVYSSKYAKGVITNKQGYFQLNVPEEESHLIISHVSYNEIQVKISNKSQNSDSIRLDIILEKSTNYLSPIDIVESMRWQVVKPERVWVYDYEFLDNNEMLLLLKDTAKYELRYLSADKRIVDNLTLKKNNFCKLLKDGLGNTHLALSDSLRQIYPDGNQLSFYSAIHKKEYSSILLPIVAQTKSLFILEEHSLNNQRLDYYSIKKDTKEKKIIAEIYSQERYKYSVEVKKKQMSYFGINHMGELTIDQLHIRRLYFEWGSYFEKVAILPVYSPLIQFGECICVFDLVNGFLSIFNADGELIKEQQITFHENKKVYSIQVDQATGDFYSLWKKNGIVQIDKINMQNGTVAKTYILKDYLNPEKVQFRNGQIYFLYSDYNFNKKLFKMPVSRL